MNAIELIDVQPGQKYYIHQVKDEHTRAPISLKYVAVCTHYYMYGNDNYEFGFDPVIGINTEDLEYGLDIYTGHQDRWGIYKIYSVIDSSASFLIDSSALKSQKNKIIERAIERAFINTTLRRITGDPTFKFY